MGDVIDFNRLKLGKRPWLPAVGVAVAVLIALLAGLWWGFTQEVGPSEVAIRQVYFGPGKGVQETVYGPGLHLVVPGYERLHLFPRDMQKLEFNSSEKGYSDGARQSISIQTSDGYNVSVDITILYRVTDPYKVVTKVGFGRAYEDKIVVKRSDKILREILGKLVAEDFFNDKVRMAAGEVVRQDLSADLETWGIQVWAVLVRSYRYDDRFQGIIESRKVEDQRLFKNQAEKQREIRKAAKEEALAKLRAQIAVIKQEGQNKIRTIKADADTYYRSQVAAGNKEVALAEADGDRWIRGALEKAGASNLVGLEMAETLEGTEIIVVSTTGQNGYSPLDLDKMLKGW